MPEQIQADHDLLIVLATKVDILIEEIKQFREHPHPLSLKNEQRVISLECNYEKVVKALGATALGVLAMGGKILWELIK